MTAQWRTGSLENAGDVMLGKGDPSILLLLPGNLPLGMSIPQVLAKMKSKEFPQLKTAFSAPKHMQLYVSWCSCRALPPKTCPVAMNAVTSGD